jgi:ketosteroid isomerase-like protein
VVALHYEGWADKSVARYLGVDRSTVRRVLKRWESEGLEGLEDRKRGRPKGVHKVDLMSHGEARAEEFLAALAFEDAWRSQDPDAAMSYFVEDAELVSSAPFPSRGSHRGKRHIRSFVAEHLAGDVRVDLTKKQVARNGVAWTVRLLEDDGSHNGSEGVAEVQFQEGMIKAVRLGAEA